MAYETREHFPDKHIWITNEIIHNPIVNEHLRQKDISFVPVDSSHTKDFSQIQSGDVVILPAFGASVEELSLLETKKCLVVDTTCPWVSRVWNRIAKYEQQEFTAVIHGKYNHEETLATSSRSKHYLIVQNLDEAAEVCHFILKGGDKQKFLNRFKQAVSPDFDPDRNLLKIGIANQTTMLKSETEQIGKLFEKTMLTKYGPASLDKHFLSPGDTICDATQERQDAILKLINEQIDMVLVIGGFNSSNTGHLQEIAEAHGLKSFHIDGPDCLGPGSTIRHKSTHSDELLETQNFLPAGHVTIGVTSGASTPDQVVEQVLEKIFAISEVSS
jgi:4-hydroxy-3-methylbut-2-enyl diphosphate reductase